MKISILSLFSILFLTSFVVFPLQEKVERKTSKGLFSSPVERITQKKQKTRYKKRLKTKNNRKRLTYRQKAMKYGKIGWIFLFLLPPVAFIMFIIAVVMGKKAVKYEKIPSDKRDFLENNSMGLVLACIFMAVLIGFYIYAVAQLDFSHIW